MARPTLVVLGPKGTRWLFAIIMVSALGAWLSESLLGVLDPNDRIAYPVIAAAFAALTVLVWRAPGQLRQWQRCGVSVVVLYFTLSMLAFTLRPGPGPSLYTMGSFAPWSLGGSLLVFCTWRARHALVISLGMLGAMFLPPALLRMTAQPPPWLVDSFPLIVNLGLCQLMFCCALYGLSRQMSRLALLAPAAGHLATANDLVSARLAELERSNAAAEAASRAKSDFLANIGHEIRTPMNTVLGQTRLLLANRLQPGQRTQLQEVANAGEALLRLIDGLLDYADLDAGRMQLADEPLHLEQLLGQAFEAVRPAAQARQLELLCEISSPDLLAGAGARRGDAARLTQLITELLVNAVKFTPAGQVRLIADLAGDGAWVLRVRDSGVGMSAEQLDRLFTPFGQAEAGATRRFGGTGLGLAICRSLAQRMNGSLAARSTLGRGSEFELRLPLPPCNELPPLKPHRVGEVMLVQAAHSAGHDALVAMLKVLAPAAHITLVNQGEQALAALDRPEDAPPCDLLIVDWVLPDMEGGELMERLQRQRRPAAHRIVLLSAFDTPLLRVRAHRQGAQALCAKPLLPHTLRHLLDLDRPLLAEAPAPEPADPAAEGGDPATLLGQLDALLDDADSRALTLWETHESTFIDLLPAQRARALAGAMQRFDFDEAQAALRGERRK